MEDAWLKERLARARTISPRPLRAPVPMYRILPVNPRFAGEELFGERVVGSLLELQGPVDILDVFYPLLLVPALPGSQETLRGLRYWGPHAGASPHGVVLERAGLPWVGDRCLITPAPPCPWIGKA